MWFSHCPVWIQKRLILMTFRKYSPLDPWKRPKLPENDKLSVWAEHSSRLYLGVLRMKNEPRRSATHHMSSMDPKKTDLWYWWLSANAVYWINGRAKNCLKMTIKVKEFMDSCQMFGVYLGSKKSSPNKSSYTSHVQFRSKKDWYWWLSANTVHSCNSLSGTNASLIWQTRPYGQSDQ